MLTPFIFVPCFTLSCSFLFAIIGILQKTWQHVHSIFSVYYACQDLVLLFVGHQGWCGDK